MPSSPRRRALRAVLPCLALLLPGVGLAAGAVGAAPSPPPTLAELISDLRDGDGPDRRLAARELRVMVRNDVRQSARGGPTSESRLEALGRLKDHDERTAPACLEVLDRPEAVVPCVVILGLLETADARAPLTRLASEHERKRVRRKAGWALARLAPPDADTPDADTTESEGAAP